MSSPATVQERTHQRCADLLAEVLNDDALSHLQRLLCQALAARDMPTHPICKGLTSLALKGDEEKRILTAFRKQVQMRLPALYKIFEENDLLEIELRRSAYIYLELTAESTIDREYLSQLACREPMGFTRPPDNPLRLITDSATGEGTLGDIGARTPMSDVLHAQAFLRAVAPKHSPGRAGRQKGIQKPKQSGRAPLPHDEARAVFQAMEGDGKDWKYCARSILKKKIPLDHQERERLRAYVDRLKYKGSILKKPVR